jgi:ribosomal protein S18 acetylase RimI-like enzyme
MDLREERPSDRESVRNVQLQAFGGDHGPVVTRLIDALRELITPGGGLSLVAELDGQVVGHVMFTRSLLDAPRRLVDVQVLSPLGALPGHQRRGVGSALVRHGLAAMAEQGALWALVHRERAALAEDLAGLTVEQWRHGTLCGEWDVEQVVAHLTAHPGLPWRGRRACSGPPPAARARAGAERRASSVERRGADARGRSLLPAAGA